MCGPRTTQVDADRSCPRLDEIPTNSCRGEGLLARGPRSAGLPRGPPQGRDGGDSRALLPRGPRDACTPESPLTRRELQILQLLANGLSQERIAKGLFIGS